MLPSSTKNDCDRDLKFAIGKMDTKDAPRYTSKAFRRGASQKLLQHGSSIAAIKSSGEWSGSGFGSYIYLEFDMEKAIPKILTAQIRGDSSSEEGSEKPTRKRGDPRKRKFKKIERRSKNSSSSSGLRSTSESD